jgi:hypothetical protein
VTNRRPDDLRVDSGCRLPSRQSPLRSPP